MFILPPPPKSSAFYPVAGVGGYYRDGAPQMLEATNTSTRFEPEDDYLKLNAPEGVYTPKECVFVATPLPHPSDPPPAVVNPLAPTHTQPWMHSSGIRLSTAILQSDYHPTVPNASAISRRINSAAPTTRPHRQSSTTSAKSFSGWTQSLFSQKKNSIASSSDQVLVEEDQSNVNSDGGSTTSGQLGGEVTLSSSAPAGGGGLIGNPLTRKDTVASAMAVLTPVASAGAATTGGTNAANDKKRKPKNSLSKNNSSFVSRTVIHESQTKRINDRSLSDLFVWVNVGRSISWLDFSPANPTVHHEPLMKILFTKAHPLCHDINNITKSAQNLDMAVGMSSGDILWVEYMSARYNRINKNGDVTRSAVTDIRWIPGSDNLLITGHADGSLAIFDKDREDGGFSTTQKKASAVNPRSTSTFKIIKSILDNADSQTPAGQQQQVKKTNPVAVYKVSNSPITSIKFSPTSQMVAITNKDGYLRLLNLASEELSDIFPSYYGGFLSVNFSPDGKYLATGGQDDMLCIWSIEGPNYHLVARGQGHTSWVRQVAFDPWCFDDTNYRIGSVGDDGKLLLWDFNPKSLPRAKTLHHHGSHQRATSGAAGHDINGDSKKSTKLHEFVSQSETPVIPPVVAKAVLKKADAETEPLSDLQFLSSYIVVAAKDGRIYQWERPTSSS